VLGLGEANRDDDHILLESPGFQLVVHRIPDHSAGNAARRTTYSSREGGLQTGVLRSSLESIRTIVSAHGSTMESRDKEWSFNGVAVCDAVDPEGNMI